METPHPSKPLLETLKSPVSLPGPENCSATLESDRNSSFGWRFSLQKQLSYLPLEVLEGGACQHIFIKLQLSVLVCWALQAHSALGHFLVRRSHRQRGSQHHHGMFYKNRSYFNVPEDHFHNHLRALRSSNKSVKRAEA